MNHLHELMIDGKHLRSRTHEVKPCVTREIINKTNIIREEEGVGPQTFECTRSNEATEIDSLEENGSVRCFANLQSVHVDNGLEETEPRLPELVNSFR